MSDDPSQDVVFLHSATDDGDGVRVVRARQGRVEVGEVRPLADGKPVTGEVVTLKPRTDAPRVCDVKVEYAPEAAAPATDTLKGPAQVASARYRNNWDAIFGEPAADGKKTAALN